MAERARDSHLSPREAEQEHRVRHQESESLFDLHAYEQGTLSISDTPFRPPVKRHTAMLAGARSDEQRANMTLHLQRTYGNRYVQRLIESMRVQAKLTVSAPNDVYEQEADRVADAVTRTITTKTQRQEEEEEEIQAKPVSSIQRQEVPEEEEEEIQTQQIENKPAAVSENLETRINAARGNGQPMMESLRASLEPQFGIDLSDIRIHTDTESDKLSQQLKAKAFTTGRDIFFRQSEYSPGSESGKKLIAHELTHVVQQKDGEVNRVRGQKGQQGTQGLTRESMDEAYPEAVNQISSVSSKAETQVTTGQNQKSTPYINTIQRMGDITDEFDPVESKIVDGAVLLEAVGANGNIPVTMVNKKDWYNCHTYSMSNYGDFKFIIGNEDAETALQMECGAQKGEITIDIKQTKKVKTGKINKKSCKKLSSLPTAGDILAFYRDAKIIHTARVVKWNAKNPEESIITEKPNFMVPPQDVRLDWSGSFNNSTKIVVYEYSPEHGDTTDAGDAARDVIFNSKITDSEELAAEIKKRWGGTTTEAES